MLHIAIYICTYVGFSYQYKVFASIDTLDLNVFLSDYNCTNGAVYFSNLCFANLPAVISVVKYSSITNNFN